MTALEIKQTKEREIAYLMILLALYGLPRTIQRVQAVLAQSPGQWHITAGDIAELLTLRPRSGLTGEFPQSHAGG
jgi:hypothetical protein